MTRRYYVPDLIQHCGVIRSDVTRSGIIELPAEEAAHAVRVMRVSTGDVIELFDGLGNQATAEITHAAKRQCLCRIESVAPVDREPSARLTMAMAMPKPERAKEMIERLTEIGVHRIQPLVFERTQRPPTANLIDKLSRVVIEACKQSGRNHAMTISPPLDFPTWITEYRQESGIVSTDGSDLKGGLGSRGGLGSIGGDFAYVAMPLGRPTPIPSLPQPVDRPVEQSAPQSAQAENSSGPEHVGQPDPQPDWIGGTRGRPTCTVVVGPEGGLTDSELQDCLDASMVAIDLGKRILRIETAACVFASRVLID